MIPSTRIVVLLLAMLVGASSAYSSDEIIEMCDASGLSSREVQVRGLARATERGFLMSDGTCPAVSADGTRVPMMIRVTRREFGRRIDRRLFEQMQDQIEKPLLQIVVKGRLICRLPLSVTEKSSDSLTRGTGFGGTGLVSCVIDDASIVGLWRFN